MARIELTGAPNTRDLGGITTQDGRKIVPKRLLRSGDLSTLTSQDCKILVEQYHLKRVVDFRTQQEQTKSPDVKIEGVQYIDNPILGKAILGITHESTKKQTDLYGLIAAGIQHMRDTGLTVVQYMRAMYQQFVHDQFSRKQYAKFFDILLNADNGATLWHCSAGKDRVGTGTALLLSMLGVDRQTIIEDYLLTGQYTKDNVQHILDMLDFAHDENMVQLTRQIMGVDSQYIGAVFDAIDQEFGGTDNFFATQLGMTPDRIAKLQSMYLSK